MAFSPAPLLGAVLLVAGVVTATAAPVPSPATGRSPAARAEGLAGPGSRPQGPGAGPPLLRAPALLAEEASGAAWRWPLPGTPRVVRPFAPGATPYSPGHRGVDLSPPGASGGVLAPAGGVVTFAGQVAGRPVVVITHAEGLRSTLEPVTAAVPAGTAVRAGDRVGPLTGTGSHCAPAVCLHWGVLRGDVYLDPLGFVTVPPIVLLPWDP